MLNKSTENFLEEYFLYTALLGERENERLFAALADAFAVKESERKVILAATRQEEVRDILSLSDYNRHLRLKQYFGMSNQTKEEDLDLEYVITVKGQALFYLEKIKVDTSETLTQTGVLKRLMELAAESKIVALRVLGTIQCEGVYLQKDVKKGIKNLKKAAAWGNINAAVTLLKYDENERSAALSILTAAALDTPFADLVDVMRQKYLLPAVEKDQNVALLKKAFGLQNVKKDEYNYLWGRMLQTKIIDIADKYKLVLSESTSAIATCCDLPLLLTYGNIENGGVRTPYKREEEERKIDEILANADLRKTETYRPLCLVTNDRYLKRAYTQALFNAFPNENVRLFNVAELDESEVDNTADNVIVRAVQEDKNNVIVLSIRGEVNGSVLERVADFIKSAKRKNYYMRNPGVTIDLSAVLPVVICDAENADKLKEVVDTVRIAEMKKAERRIAVADTFTYKCKNYLIEKAEIEDAVIDKLAVFAPEKAEKILENAVKALRAPILHLTLDEVEKYIAEYTVASIGYGFGGKIDEA